MPTDGAKLKKALQELSLALAKESMDRQKREAAHVRKIAIILTRISKLVGTDVGGKIEDLGKEFAHACNHGLGPGLGPGE